jgi:GNAT superfamily N-acetyltransferase
MRVRPANASDLSMLMALGKEMYLESNYTSVEFNEDKLALVGTQCLNDPVWLVTVAEHSDGEILGMFVGYISQFIFSFDLVACDFVLYVKPEYRGSSAAVRLVMEYVRWAKDKGAKIINIGTTTGVATAETVRFYEGLGFAQVGAVFRMEVK